MKLHFPSPPWVVADALLSLFVCTSKVTSNIVIYSLVFWMVDILKHASVLVGYEPCILIHSFTHYGHFYSAPSSPLLLRGAPDYSMDTVSEFHAEAHRQLQVKDLPKVPTWRLERESNP